MFFFATNPLQTCCVSRGKDRFKSPRPVAVVVRKSEIFVITKELRSFERLCEIFCAAPAARPE
jgi:hypothetical protein